MSISMNNYGSGNELIFFCSVKDLCKQLESSNIEIRRDGVQVSFVC